MQTLFYDWILPLTAAGSAVCLLLLLLAPLTGRRLSARWHCLAWGLALLFFVIPIRFPAAALPAAWAAQAAQWPLALAPQAAALLPQAAAPAASLSLAPAAAGLWLAGALLLTLLRLTAAVRFDRLLRVCCIPEADPKVLAQLARCREELGIGRQVLLLRCDRLGSPLLTGLLRPRILLPQTLPDPARLEWMLRHELIHLRRHDLARKLAALAVSTLHWFNPLAWLLARRMGLLCELACDETLVRGMDADARRGYGGVILDAAGTAICTPPLSSAFSSSHNQLKRRLFAIMNLNQPSRPRRLAGLCAAALLLCTGVTVSSLALADATAASPASVALGDASQAPEVGAPTLSIQLKAPVPDAPYTNGFGGAVNHLGIDFIAKEGADVLASAPGTVVWAYTLDALEPGESASPYGNHLILDHGDGIKTLYGHCSELLVKEGDQVKAGDLIARIGQTGHATGPNLHFELRSGVDPLDPADYLGK